MKIKARLLFGVGFLFLLIALLAVLSTWYVNVLKSDTNHILTANYNTLEYSRNMILALDQMRYDTSAVHTFEINLQKQKENETEPGEKEATDQVAAYFVQIKSSPQDTSLKPVIRQEISAIMLLNMDAIKRKSDLASHTAETATIWIAVTGCLCFLIAFILLVNLPGNIANPIRELTESIKQIAAQNYHQRVHFESHSEFGELARSFNSMAQKLEEFAGSNLANILREKKRIDTLINNMSDPVIGLDENHKILFANDKALQITGLKKEEITGRPVAEVTARNDLIRKLLHEEESGEEGIEKASSQPLKIYADKKESYFEKEVIKIDIVPAGETASREIGQVILLKNITPFKELEYAKTNFIATISHELKTPIASIQMSIQLLEHAATGRLNEEQIKLVESIKEDNERLLKITGELLKMTQLESGNIQLNMQRGDLHSIVEYAVEATRTQAEQKQINTRISEEETVPSVNIDIEKTAWVLINFITNAIRYSPENSQLIISLKYKENKVILSVQDFGKGIEPQYKERIFDRYFQVPGSAKSGTGLGLSISKDFIEAQGGTIGVDTKPGMGSTFYFCLPAEMNVTGSA